jgi:hypothetical protein
MRRPSLCATVGLLLFSCTSPGSDASAPVIRDSLGTRIVENSLEALAAAPEWHLFSSPTPELGELDGPDPFSFYQVTGAARLHGLVWVLNRASSELRAFHEDGSHALTVGRHGEGPGEFTFALDLFVIDPDTLVVWDRGNLRVSYFDAGGTFLRAVPVLRNFQNPGLINVFEDGSLLFSDSRPILPRTGGIEHEPIYLVRFAPDGSSADSLGVFPGGGMKKIDAPPGYTFVLFAPVTRFGGGQATFWLGTGEELEIQERNPAGETVRIVRWEVPDRSVRQEHVDAIKSPPGEGEAEGSMQAQFRRMMAEAPAADKFPALDQIVVDRVGRIWVRQYLRPLSEGDEHWIVFGPQGTVLARIQTPRGLYILDIGEDYLLGRANGDFGEEYIRLFDIKQSSDGD